MDYKDISRAITFIRPGAEFVLTNDELTWLDKTQTEPTKAEIEAGIAAFKAEDAKQEAATQAAKESAQAKLTALGLTTDDLKALGLGGN
jgi:ribonucleotide monophosphatase NagD (HAD superfamily)